MNNVDEFVRTKLNFTTRTGKHLEKCAKYNMDYALHMINYLWVNWSVLNPLIITCLWTNIDI